MLVMAAALVALAMMGTTHAEREHGNGTDDMTTTTSGTIPLDSLAPVVDT